MTKFDCDEILALLHTTVIYKLQLKNIILSTVIVNVILH